MIAEIGLFALIIALLFSILLIVMPYKNNSAWGLFLFTFLSFACLVICFLHNDFAVLYVAAHSSISLPWFYKLCAVWGGHEGSMLLWLLILTAWNVAVAIFSKTIEQDLRVRMLVILGMVSLGFICFILFTSNPFLQDFHNTNIYGNDLNPLLQDLGFLLHPPLLYMGYVGFAVPFAFAIATLWLGKTDSKAIKWIRPWTLIPWSLLTLGVTLGSWWAYRELGWGGFWFWDPVENASLMPWLIGTALIHAWMIVQKREIGVVWSLLLAITAFALSLIGTFLVRSGVLTSVHAFAVDPTRGLFILLLLTLTIGGALTLFACRISHFQTKMRMMLWSRESLLFLSQVLLFVALLTVLLGTVYPLLIDGLGLGKLSVGMPYFNSVFMPLILPVYIIMGTGIHARWQQESGSRLISVLKSCIISSLILTIFALIILRHNHTLSVLLSISVLIAIWSFITTIYGFYGHLKRKQFKSIGLGYAGMTLAHLGMIVLLLGIAISTGFGSEREIQIAIGETYRTPNYSVKFIREEKIDAQNYSGMRGIFEYSEPNKQVLIMPEKRVYTIGQRVMTEAAINISPVKDIYLALGERFEDGTWTLRIYVKPLVRWIWLGGCMIFAGGLLAFIKRSKL